MRRESLEVIIFPGLNPGLLPQNAGSRQLLNQRLRQLDLLVVTAPQLANGCRCVAVRFLHQVARGQLIQKLTETRIRSLLMRQSADVSHLLRTIFACGRRHIRPFVPAEGLFD